MQALPDSRVGVFVAGVIAALAATSSLAVGPRIERPNQYPSPSVEHTSADGAFDADYPWSENNLTGDWGGWRTELATQAWCSTSVTSRS